MYRLTARILLVLLLVGTFAPAALAVSGPAPHACCLRKMHSRAPEGKTFQAIPHAGNNSCCPPITVELWAEPALQVRVDAGFISADSSPLLPAVHYRVDFNSSDSVRGPPSSSTA